MRYRLWPVEGREDSQGQVAAPDPQLWPTSLHGEAPPSIPGKGLERILEKPILLSGDRKQTEHRNPERKPYIPTHPHKHFFPAAAHVLRGWKKGGDLASGAKQKLPPSGHFWILPVDRGENTRCLRLGEV